MVSNSKNNFRESAQENYHPLIISLYSFTNDHDLRRINKPFHIHINPLEYPLKILEHTRTVFVCVGTESLLCEVIISELLINNDREFPENDQLFNENPDQRRCQNTNCSRRSAKRILVMPKVY